MSDDEIIGLKSTSIKFKNNINMFLFCIFNFYYFEYFIYLKILWTKYFYTFFNYYFILSLVYQLIQFKKKNLKKIS